MQLALPITCGDCTDLERQLPTHATFPTSKLSSFERTAAKVRWLPALKLLDLGPLDTRFLLGYASALALAVLALATRKAADPFLADGFPFLTFFPAVIIAGFIFGLYPGIACGIVSAVFAWYFFLEGAINAQAAVAILFFASIVAIDLFLIHLMHRAVSMLERASAESERLAAERALYVSELDHRIKNVFATTAALVSLTARRAKTPAEMALALQDRLTALGRGADLLRIGRAQDERTYADLFELVLAPMSAKGAIVLDRTQLDRPAPAQSTAALSLIIHELGTNAVKYGGLSTPDGQVHVSGTIAPDNDSLVIRWEETGGPPPVSNAVHGFGTYLLENITRTLGGKLNLDFRPTGLIATFPISLS